MRNMTQVTAIHPSTGETLVYTGGRKGITAATFARGTRVFAPGTKRLVVTNDGSTEPWQHIGWSSQPLHKARTAAKGTNPYFADYTAVAVTEASAPEAPAKTPTAPQARWINEAIDTDGTFRANLPAKSRDIMIAAGWLIERLNYAGGATATPRTVDHVTDAGRRAVRRSDTITLPNVQVGDVLMYRTDPGHSFRVTAVLNGGQQFQGVTLTAGNELETGARVGRDEHTAEFNVMAYQVRPAPVLREGPVAAAAARTGADGARTLIPTAEAGTCPLDCAGHFHDSGTVDQATAAPLFATKDDVVREIAEAIESGGGATVDEYDTDAIFTQAYTWCGPRQGFICSVTDEQFWAIAQDNERDVDSMTMTFAESAEVAEGQVLAAVAQAARANGCPPLCDASAVLHIVLYDVTGMDPVLWQDQYAPEPLTRSASGFSV